MSKLTLLERVQDEADLCRNEGASDIAALLDEVAAALAAQAVPSDVERDAERYRWLRDANKSDAALPYDELIALSMDSLDAAIDEEIGKA